MKRFINLFLLIGFATSVYAQGETEWKLDRTHSSIKFEATHMAISEVSGQFQDFSADIFTQGDDWKTADITVNIDASSIDSDNEKRDNHLKSDDFLHVEAHPQITFESSTLNKTGENQFDMEGELTINGVTNTETFNVKHQGTVEGMQGETKAGFKITGTINRFDYNVDWNKTFTSGLVVGEEIDLIADVELEKVEQTASKQ